MTTPHQDARLEAAMTTGLGRLVDAVRDMLPGEAPLLLDAVRPRVVAAAGDVLLELLASLGVDTSAHVRTHSVSVHIHRPDGG